MRAIVYFNMRTMRRNNDKKLNVPLVYDATVICIYSRKKKIANDILDNLSAILKLN